MKNLKKINTIILTLLCILCFTSLKTGISRANTETSENPYPEKNMVLISGGDFIMGNNSYPNAKPEHSVTVKSFYIGKYEVTNEEYCLFLNSCGNKMEGGWGDYYRWIDMTRQERYLGIEGGPVHRGTFSVKKGYEKLPVVYVSWYGAVAYCNWLSEQEQLTECYGGYNILGEERMANFDPEAKGYRLPTEEEWEYACRGGTENHDYYWGKNYDSENNPIGDYCIYRGNCSNNTQKVYIFSGVGTKMPNEFGLYDMAGNVWEWCNNWYKPYKTISEDNPYIMQENYKVIRGGSFDSEYYFLQSSIRFIALPAGGLNYNIGFRVVRSN